MNPATFRNVSNNAKYPHFSSDKLHLYLIYQGQNMAQNQNNGRLMRIANFVKQPA